MIITPLKAIIVFLVFIIFLSYDGIALAAGDTGLDAVILSHTIRPSMEGLGSYDVSVTVRNTGTVTWNESTLIRLGGFGDYGGDASKFGCVRVVIGPGTNVAPGQQYTFNFMMTAPLEAGTYTPRFQMVRDGVAWFGQQLAVNVTVSGIAAYPDAAYVNDTIPAMMTMGASQNVSITFRNTGTQSWNRSALIRLGGVGDSSGDAAELGVIRLFIPSGTNIAPGQTYTFQFVLSAPFSQDTYEPTFRMVWDGHKWFGEKISRRITVYGAPFPAPDAVIVSETIPSQVKAGQKYPVSITVRNTGTITWAEGIRIRLGAVGDYGGDAYRMSAARQFLPPGTTVSAGQEYTWNFNLTAPSSAGVYSPSWRMVWDGQQWFGRRLDKTITVIV